MVKEMEKENNTIYGLVNQNLKENIYIIENGMEKDMILMEILFMN